MSTIQEFGSLRPSAPVPDGGTILRTKHVLTDVMTFSANARIFSFSLNRKIATVKPFPLFPYLALAKS